MAEIKLKGRSFDQIRRLVSDALKVQYPNASWVWIKDEGLYGDTVIYTVEMETGNPRKQTYVASYSIDKTNVVTLADIKPAQIKQSVEVASFSCEIPEFTEADFSAAGDEIVKPCLLFKAGDYTETRGINVTIQDLDSIVIPNFTNIKIEDEHPILKGRRKPSKWSGKIGRVVNTWRVDDTLYGNVAFSKWVGEAFKGERPSLSISLDPKTKHPREVSLVDDPYFEEAGVLSAFSVDPEQVEEPRKGKPMSNFFGTLAEKLGLSKAEVESEMAEFSKADTSALEARLKAVEAENVTLKQGLSTFSAVQSADALANKVLQAKKIIPAQFESVRAAFAKAIEQDGANFSNDGSATKTLESVFESMPEHSFYKPADFSSFSLAPMGGAEPVKFKDSESVMAQLNGGAN